MSPLDVPNASSNVISSIAIGTAWAVRTSWSARAPPVGWKPSRWAALSSQSNDVIGRWLSEWSPTTMRPRCWASRPAPPSIAPLRAGAACVVLQREAPGPRPLLASVRTSRARPLLDGTRTWAVLAPGDLVPGAIDVAGALGDSSTAPWAWSRSPWPASFSGPLRRTLPSCSPVATPSKAGATPPSGSGAPPPR